MKYSSTTSEFVEKSVVEWVRKDLYPKEWKERKYFLVEQNKGAHAECAAFIYRYGEVEGRFKWYEAANEKREQFGSDRKQRDGYDLVGKSGELIDAKWVPEYDQIWVTETTHRSSAYTALAGVKFNSSMDEFEVYYISRSEFDAACQVPKSNKNKLRVHLSDCKKVDSL